MTKANLPNGLPITYDLFDYILEQLESIQSRISNQEDNDNKIIVRGQGLNGLDKNTLILTNTVQFKAKSNKDVHRVDFPNVSFTSNPIVMISINDIDSDTRQGPQAYATVFDVTKKSFKVKTFYSGKQTSNIPVSFNYIAIGNANKPR